MSNCVELKTSLDPDDLPLSLGTILRCEHVGKVEFPQVLSANRLMTEALHTVHPTQILLSLMIAESADRGTAGLISHQVARVKTMIW